MTTSEEKATYAAHPSSSAARTLSTALLSVFGWGLSYIFRVWFLLRICILGFHCLIVVTIAFSAHPRPANANPPPVSTKPKPRSIYQYYDRTSLTWKEFNPADTVVGDETDPFIVYFRCDNKSIGSRRKSFILVKHPQLIRILQDCLADHDWRPGEDLLVFPMISVGGFICRLNRLHCICDVRHFSMRQRS
jgi:hypothetical protein